MKPISRRELVRRLKTLGFTGPFAGGRHSFMCRGQLKLRVHNPHEGDISVSLLKEILRQAGISEDEWTNTGL
ncbi:MAG: type II toxin-antitoxin system HicA family toxin [Synergistota bacterium]|nr:type II toxin-antitoxin system HicA family toxin [Synergistota bacterium]